MTVTHSTTDSRIVPNTTKYYYGGSEFVWFFVGVLTTVCVTYTISALTTSTRTNASNVGHEEDSNNNNKETQYNSKVRDKDPTNEQQQQQQQQESNKMIYDSADLDLRLIRKAEAVIQNRTTSLCIVIERCTSEHNYSAILRTAEALGIQNIYIVDQPTQPQQQQQQSKEMSVVNEDEDDWNDDRDDGLVVNGGETMDDEEEKEKEEDRPTTGTTTKQPVKHGIQPPKFLTNDEKMIRQKHKLFAQNATEWLTIKEFTNTKECIATVRADGYKDVWVTDLSQQAIKLTISDLQHHQAELDNHTNHNTNPSVQVKQVWPLPKKLAICVGTEAVGASYELLMEADVRVYIPLVGFADSLNLSVATAMVVQLLFVFQPHFATNAISETEKHSLRQLWYPKLASQRLLTPKEKKRYKQLHKWIDYCTMLQLKRQQQQEQLEVNDIDPTTTTKRKVDPLTPHQQLKLSKVQDYYNELNVLNAKLEMGKQTVQELIDNPPQPLCDLRRTDMHRITFAGKNTKKLHVNHWNNIPATTKYQTPHHSTATYFRQRMMIAKNNTNNNNNTNTTTVTEGEDKEQIASYPQQQQQNQNSIKETKRIERKC